MTPDSAPPVIPGLRPPANPLDPAVRRLWSTVILLNGIPAAAGAAGAAGLATRFTDIPLGVLLIPAALILVGSLVGAFVIPPISFRHYRWEITAAGLTVQRGWLMREFIAVPHSRIQTVETRRGPLERFFNLASAGISTAAGEAVRVPGLTVAAAAELQADLSARTGQGEGA